MRFLTYILLATSLSSHLFSQQVTRGGLLQEWLGSSGISRSGEAPYELQDTDTWQSTLGQNLTVKDANANDSLQVVATNVAGGFAIEHTGTSNNVDLEGAAMRTSNAQGLAVTWDFWIMLGDLSTDAIIFETGGGTHGASITVGDGDLIGDDDAGAPDRRDDLRVVLGGSGTNHRLILDMDLPDTVTSQFHHVAVVYDGQDLILYLDGSEVVRHPTGSAQNQWQGTDAMGLLGQGGSAIGGDGGTGLRPFKDTFTGAKALAVFRYYDRGLTAQEVYVNYRAEADLIFADMRLHHWKLDEASGATEAADDSDAPINLAITGATPEAVGIIGNAYTFTHPGSHLLHSFADNQTISRYSLSIWAKAASLGQPTNASIFNIGDAGNDYQVGISNDIYYYMGDSGNLHLGPVTTEWVHIVLAQNGDQLETYYDGKLAVSETRTDTLFESLQVGTNRAQNTSFAGLIDDVVITTETLFPPEIAAIYGLGKFSGVAFDDAKIDEALALSNGEKVEDVGPDAHIWQYAMGLTGAAGSVTGTIAERNAIIVLREDGTGLRYDGMPGDVPEILSYGENPAIYSKDASITPNAPDSLGSPTSYALSGTLPDGLTFDTATGIISGTPTVLASEAIFQITATNASGDSVTFDLTITVTDLTGPVLSLSGSSKVYVEIGTAYVDAGATATDNVDVSIQVEASDTLDLNTAGIYSITYTATDAAGNTAVPITREVVVEDLSPIVSTVGELIVSINQPDPYENDLGAEVDAFPHVPLAYYSMAGHALDTSKWGYGHDATIQGTATFVTETHDQKGQSLYLDGSGGLPVPGWKVIQGTTARTLSAWIKTDFPLDATAFDAGILGWGNSAIAGEKWVFRVQSSDGTSGAIRVEVNGGAIIGSTVVADNQWHHVAAVLPDGATEISDIKLYVDGVEETPSATINHGINTGNVEDLKIGSDSANRHFLGHLDDIAIFDVALSAQEIGDYFAATALAITDDIDSIDTETPGAQTITYTATDASDRSGTSTRIVEVIDVTPPTISFLNNSETVNLTVDQVWNPQTDVLTTDNTDGVLISASNLDLPRENIRLHLSADSLAAQLSQHDPVQQWEDLSAFGHHVTQDDPVRQPEFFTGVTFTGGTLVGDSLAEFSGTQGKEGWHYGYHEGTFPYDPGQFTALAGGSGNGSWEPVNQHWTGDADDTNGTWDLVQGAESWIEVASLSMHPQAVVSGTIDLTQQAVRRWISDVEGMIGISGYFNNTSGTGDGTFGRIFHNGVEEYSVFTDGSRADFNVHFIVAIGDSVDFVVDEGPGGNSDSDTTNMEATILHEPTITHASPPTVRFDGNDFLDRLDSLGLTGSPQFTVSTVVKATNTGKVLYVGKDPGDGGEIITFHGDASIRYNNGNKEFRDNPFPNSTWNASTWMVDTSRGYGDAEFYSDGIAAISTSSAVAGTPLIIPTTGTRTMVSASLDSSSTLRDIFLGDMAELIVMDTKVTPQQLNALHFYLSSKHGLDLGANGGDVATLYDTSVTHTATVTYYVTDEAGNTASAIRTVIVSGNNTPVISITGDNPIQTALGQPYSDPGGTASDVEDGDLTDDLQIDPSAVDTSQLGTYTVSYTVTDSAGKSALESRVVEVVDLTPPVVELLGEDNITIGQWSDFVDEGVTASDNVDDANTLLANLLFLPLDGLVLHLDAGQIAGLQDADPVESWMDLSGNGNDANQIMLPSSQPIYVASTSEAQRPAVRFDGNDDYLQIDDVLAGGTIGRTLFAVFRPESSVNSTIISLNSNSVRNADNSSYTYIMTPEIGLRVANNKMFVNDVLSTSELSIVGVGNAADALISDARAWKNGAELEFTSFSGSSMLDIAGYISTIGGRSPTDSNIAGDAYEILVYDRLLDDDEIRLLQYHLQTKYSLSGSASIVDSSKLGTQSVHYMVRDSAGNFGTASRTVNVVVDTWSPVISLTDGENLEVVLNTTYNDPGFTVSDDKDPDLAGSVQTLIKDAQGQTVQSIDTSVDAATFTITYSVTDSDGHVGTATRNITIIDADIVAPEITMNGLPIINHPVGQPFTDPGATATDNVDGDIDPTPASDVDADTVGTYTITYSATDAAGNVATPLDRTVRVQDLSPVIVLQGASQYDLDQDAEYIDPGARAIVLPAVPIVYLSFDQNLRDHATLDGAQDGIGNNTWSSDTPMDSGSSLEFNGTDRVTMTGYKGVLGPAARAVSLWVKADPSINNSSKELAHYGSSGALRRFTLRVNNTANYNEFRTDVDNGYTYGTTSILDNFWHHVVVSYPEGGTLTDAKLYVDSVLQSTTVGGNAETSPINTNSGDDLRVGNTFIGLIDEFLYFDQELSSAQVEALFDPEIRTVTSSPETIDTATVQTVVITYSTSHAYGDSTATRSIVVNDVTPPVISLVGTDPLPWMVDEDFVDPGVSATDNVDGDVGVIKSWEFDESGLVGQWRLEEEIGIDVIDSSPNVINGTYLAGSTLGQTGILDKAVSFDGVTGGINLGDVADMDSPSEFTVSLWFFRRSEVDNPTNHAVRNVLLAQSSNASNDNFEVGTQGSQVTIYMDSAGGTDQTVNVEAGIQNDIWHHLVVTFDAQDTESLPLRLYVDGTLIDARGEYTVSLDSSDTSPLSLGMARPNSNKWGYFDGLMDEVVIWKKALTPAQISWLNKFNQLDVSEAGKSYDLTYSASDSSGNMASVVREVIVTTDFTPPTLTLVGQPEVTISVGDNYADDGATAVDAVDGNLTPLIDIVSDVDTNTPGTYSITYNVMDMSGNRAPQLTRTVIVQAAQGDNFTAWLTATGLSVLDASLKTESADPDNDQISNLLEYAFGTDPTVSDANAAPIHVSVENNQVTIEFVRLKTAVDGNLTLSVQLTEDLSDSWIDANVTFTPTTDQNGVSANYERVEVILPAPSTTKQFLRIQVQR